MLASAVGTLAVATAVVPVAHAQSNATGTIFGKAGTDAGTTVLIENKETNAKRTVTPDSTGRFQVTSLPPGRYSVQLQKGSQTVSTVELEVLLGQGVEAVFGTKTAGQLESVQVTGSRSVIDVSSTNAGSTFTAKELSVLPIAQNVTAIIQLAPDSVKADPRYAGGASVGGGAPSENSYYINGFAVTNPLTQLGSIELPFGAIQQAQVLTGGYGAEFGRSTGGVVNITTKSGTNEWHGGVSAYTEPNALRSRERNIYYPVTGRPENAGTDGKLRIYNAENKRTENQEGAYVGGPLIKDKLFVFFAADQTRVNGDFVNHAVDSSLVSKSGWVEGRDRTDRYLGKVDWYITDEHRIEYTSLGDNVYTDQTYFPFNYNTLSRGPAPVFTGSFKNLPNTTPLVGGSANILKYTGNLTDTFTLTALYGEAKSQHKNAYNPDASGSAPGVIWTSTGRDLASGINYFAANPVSGTNIPRAEAQDKTRGFRLDVEWALGQHTLRAGVDDNRLRSSGAGEASAGGSTYRFQKTSNPTGVKTLGPYTYVVADGSVEGNKGYYVRQRIFTDVTEARSDQSAAYVEDRYQVTKNVLLTLGLRDESFKGINGDGETYLKSDNFVSPRLGGSWDVFGDSSLKVFGNLGRYSIQTPTHLAVRGASRSTLTDQYFTYTGTDPATGAPTGLHALTPAYSPDGETGTRKDPNTLAATNIKPSYQDQLILGFEKALSSQLTFGAKFTYSKLGATLDDFCDQRPFDAYAQAHNIDETNYSFNCVFINPGRSNHFKVDYAGTGTNYTDVTLTREDMGFSKASRYFVAVDLFLEHPFSNGWYGKIAYTWSRNRGNTEGQTKSDIGQTDVSATETWDFKELMENSYGNLPNDRTHQIKAIGYIQATPEWGFGGNLVVSSGRPKNCFGNYGGTSPDGDYGGYGSAFFFCSFDGGVTQVATPRGSQGRLPWDYQLDVNAIYRPAMWKGVTFRLDVFNLWNKQSIQAINEVHEADGDPSTVLATYGQVLQYSAPKSVRLTASYEF